MTPVLYWIVARLLRYLLLPLYARITVSGLENVPATGPLIIAANHLNDGDPLILSSRLPRRIVFLAKAELFDVPFFGRLLRVYGALPVRRREADLSALRQADATLKRGLALGIFPEGRSSTHAARLSEAWPGAAIVALRAQAPILPVAITGSQALQWPSVFLRLGRRSDVSVRIGELFFLPKADRLNAAAARTGTQLVMAKIAALLPEAYRGYYGNASVGQGGGATQ